MDNGLKCPDCDNMYDVVKAEGVCPACDFDIMDNAKCESCGGCLVHCDCPVTDLIPMVCICDKGFDND